MKTETHLKYAKTLANKYFSNSRFDRFLFILGSVLPDYNPFSYLKSFKIKPFFGHNWDNRKDYILSEIQKLKHRQLNAFELGKLVHYICDAFTHTHNKEFKGNLLKHAAYEKALHNYFDRQTENNKSSLENTYDPKIDFSNLHRQYLTETPGQNNDFDFIEIAVQYVLRHGIPHDRKPQTMPINKAQ